MAPLNVGSDPVKTMPMSISDKLHVTMWDDLCVELTPDRIKVRRHVAYH